MPPQVNGYSSAFRRTHAILPHTLVTSLAANRPPEQLSVPLFPGEPKWPTESYAFCPPVMWFKPCR